ncbi:MAG TPA: hypothetical protein VMW51_09735 [Terriglobia bacterium]|nr:hypothetical protein [Terriglobia bacterium]
MNELEKVLVKIGHGVEWPFVHGEQLVKLLTSVLKDEPAVKAAVVGLIQQIATITADGAIVVSGAGVNLTADMAELVAARALWNYVVTVFLPAVQGAWKDLEPTIGGLEAGAASQAAPAVVPPPGLHNVTPA